MSTGAADVQDLIIRTDLKKLADEMKNKEKRDNLQALNKLDNVLNEQLKGVYVQKSKSPPKP